MEYNLVRNHAITKWDDCEVGVRFVNRLICLHIDLDDTKSCCQLITTITVSERNQYISLGEGFQ